MNYATLIAHPLAELFRLMDDNEFEALKASIRANGIREPIRLYEGKILDGRNRHRAALEVGHNFKETDFVQFLGTPSEAEAYVLDTNASRRQMSDKDKKALIERMLAKYPSRSDRHIARLCCVSHVTVAKYRAPATDKVFDKFAKDWGSLNDSQRERFVKTFEFELRELWTDWPPRKFRDVSAP